MQAPLMANAIPAKMAAQVRGARALEKIIASFEGMSNWNIHLKNDRASVATVPNIMLAIDAIKAVINNAHIFTDMIYKSAICIAIKFAIFERPMTPPRMTWFWTGIILLFLTAGNVFHSG